MHTYAGDTELNALFNHDNFSIVKSELKHCFDDIVLFMEKNHLKLNEDETEYIHIDSCNDECNVLQTAEIKGPIEAKHVEESEINNFI